MTETLSDEEIQEIRTEINQVSADDMDSFFEGYSPSQMQKALNTIEAKDAQIRVLVEALEEIAKGEISAPKLPLSLHYTEYSCAYHEKAMIAKQALATIPAETPELAKLEREVLEASKNWDYAHYKYECNDFDFETDREMKRSSRIRLRKAVHALAEYKEAHPNA